MLSSCLVIGVRNPERLLEYATGYRCGALRFRLKYRDALIEVVGEIIRRGLKPTAEEIAALAVPLVLPEDLEQFRDLVLVEIARLHEGNIARFRLRPNELRRWQSR
jgi:hypothetical protein